MVVKRWWVSWYEPMDASGDYRPQTWPLPPSIPHYWCSGQTFDGDAATLCAVVDADTEEAAKDEVRKLWKPAGWRFCNEKAPGWMPASDRFPVKTLAPVAP